MKNNAFKARKGGVYYQPEPKVGVDTGNSLRKQRKKNAVMVISLPGKCSKDVSFVSVPR